MSPEQLPTEGLVALAMDGLRKANEALQAAIDLHFEQLRVARLDTHAAAQADLDAVTAPTTRVEAHSSDNHLP